MLTSVFVPFLPRRHEDILPYAALVQWTDAARLWQGYSPGLDAHESFVYAAATGFRVPSGIAVDLTPLRTPFHAAVQARSTALATGHPFVAGFGPGDPLVQRAHLGEPYARPAHETTQYASVVRQLLEVDPADPGMRPGRLVPLPAPPVEVAVGTLRKGMAFRAGAVADVIIGWMTPPDYFGTVLRSASEAGATSAGRAAPRNVVVVPTALARRNNDARTALMTGLSSHLQLDHYVKMLAAAGIDVSGDTAGRADALIRGGAVLCGTVDEIRSTVQRYADHGVDELVLNLAGTHALAGPDAARQDLLDLLDALR